jgi:hypothetical protein
LSHCGTGNKKEKACIGIELHNHLILGKNTDLKGFIIKRQYKKKYH